MSKKMTTLSAAVLCLLAAPLRAESDALSAAFKELSALTPSARAAAEPTRALRPRAIPTAETLPDNCSNLAVVSMRNGEIFKNGMSLGRNATSYKGNCDGVVAWQDTHGDLHVDGRKVADRISQYDIAWYGDALMWQDTHGDLHNGSENLGRVVQFTFVKHTGDVVWKDRWGDLFRNREKFGRAQNFTVAARTGDVAWTDNFGTLHRNGEELGRSQSWRISDRTGDVAWLDSFRGLYKNGVKVASGVNQFTLREDGRLIWVDSRGNTQFA